MIATFHPFLQQQPKEDQNSCRADYDFKLNTDGSSRGNPGPSSFGGLIRDSKGRWLCGYVGAMNERSYTSLEAEVWSIYKGLCLVEEKNLSNLRIEMDCEYVLRLVRDRSAGVYHPLNTILDAILKIMAERNCTFVHTKRDGNRCADLLANLGGRQDEEYAVLEEPPAMLMPYLLRDAEL